MYKYLLMYIGMKNLWGFVRIYLYTGNMDVNSIPLFVRNHKGVVLRRDKVFMKQLADVMITIDIFEDSVVKNISGRGDQRYRALVHVLKQRKIGAYLVEHFENDVNRTIKSISALV